MTEHSDRNRTGEPNGLGQSSRRDFLRTTAAAGALAAGVGAGAVGNTAAAGIPTPRLSVDGNVLVDPEGNTVRLRGINMADPKRIDVTAPARGKTASQVVDMLTDGNRGWYPRVVRVPAQPVDIGEHAPGGEEGPPTPVAFTQEQLDTYLEEYYDPIIEQLGQRGVYAIVDFHRHWTGGDTAWSGEWTSDEYQDELDEEVTMFWETVAPRYAENDHVLYEVYNEPTQDGMWGDPRETGGYADVWREWVSLAQPWVDTIREHADNIVIIGSPSWTQSPEGYYVEPFEGENLAYSYHIYGGHGVSSDGSWDDASSNGEGVAEVYEEVPLFVTEFGWETNNASVSQLQGTTSGFGEPFFEWLEASEGISYTAWCADPVWRPVMYTRPWAEDGPSSPADVDNIGYPYDGDVRVECENLPCEWELLGGENYAGEFVKQHLADMRDEDLPGAAYEEEAPPTPSNLSVEESSYTEIELSWDAVEDAGGSGLSHYTVTVDGEVAAQVYEGTSTTITDLTAESDYEIGLSASDRAGNESGSETIQASTDSFEDDTPPTAPSGLEAAEVGQNSVDLAWEPGEPGGDAWITGYRIYVDGEADGEVGPDTTETTVAGLQFETTYEIGVATTDAAGNESDVVTISATPTSPEGQEPYEGPHVIPGEVPAMHHDTGGQGVGFQTERGGGGNRPDGASMEQSSSEYQYHLAHIASGDWWEYTVEAEGPGTYQFELGAAQAAGEYFGSISVDVYVNGERVTSVNQSDTGGWQSFEAIEGGEVELPAGPNIVRLQATDGEFNIAWWGLHGEPGEVDDEAPTAPADLEVTGTSDTSADLSWSASSDSGGSGLDHYAVSVDGTEEATVDAGTTETTVSGLAPGTSYEFDVVAVDGAGNESEASDVVEATTDEGGACEDAAASETLEDGSTVCDVDGDGEYRDVTGDGAVTNSDVTEFFGNQHADPWDSRADLFDFTGDDDVTQADVIELFSSVN